MNEQIQLLNERVTQLEQELARLQSQVNGGSSSPWWDRVAGRFENDSTYDEIVRLGREYREAQRPEDE